ncbi:hypothetical protein [Micromonospora echinospora]|uniref:hypothetical protein n=1 Tax=Micromonospora echinospora TaxID=1877 RepID=UPI00366D083A
MATLECRPEGVPSFLERFTDFEDGVLTGISIVLPRGDRAGRAIEVDVQAMDRESPAGSPDGRMFDWKLVRIRMQGVEEYRFGETLQYPLQVLSDGLKIGFRDQRFFLDLDPGPDPWLPEAVWDAETSYSKQYVIARRLLFEVLHGPFI